VRFLDRVKTPLLSAPIMVNGKRDQIAVEVALWWNDAITRTCWSSPTISRSATAARISLVSRALTRQITGYAESSGLAKREKVELTATTAARPHLRRLGEGARSKFSSQTKDKLVSSEVRPAVESIVNEALGQWLEEIPPTQTVVSKVIEAAAAREAARKARDLTRARARSTWPICRASSPIARSAIRPNRNYSSSRAIPPAARQAGRNREFQAVLPCAANPQCRARALRQMLASEQIGTLITALGAGIGATSSISRSCAITRSSS